jgi:hypothetical protein
MRGSYGGVDLICANSDLDAYLSSFCDPNEVLSFEPITSHSLWHLPIPPAFTPPPIRINILNWPTEASRFATCYIVVDDEDLDTLRPICFTTNGPVAQTLLLEPETVGEIEEISTEMFALPPRPLAKIEGERQLWLLPLVDKRYFWWMRSANITGFSSWAGLFSQIGTAIGETITVSSVPAAYGDPSDRFESYQQPLPLLLDAAAATVGMRCVVQLDGTVLVENYSDSLSTQTAEIALDSTRSPRSGGQFDADDIKKSVPAEVELVFRRGTPSGAHQDNPYTISQSLLSLSLTEYDGVTGYEGSKVIYGDAVATFAGGGSPSNLTDLEDYAEQAATDWYLWQISDFDYHYNGVVEWRLNAQVDEVEWCFFADRCTTRISRNAYNEWSWGSFHLSSGIFGRANGDPTPAHGPRSTINLIATGSNIIAANSGLLVDVSLEDNDTEDQLDYTIDNLGLFFREAATGTTFGPRRRLRLDSSATVTVNLSDSPAGDEVIVSLSSVGGSVGTGIYGQAEYLPVPAHGPRDVINFVAAAPTIGDNLAVEVADDPGNNRINWEIDNLGIFGRYTYPKFYNYGFSGFSAGVTSIDVTVNATLKNFPVDAAMVADPAGQLAAKLQADEDPAFRLVNWAENAGQLVAEAVDPTDTPGVIMAISSGPGSISDEGDGPGGLSDTLGPRRRLRINSSDTVSVVMTDSPGDDEIIVDLTSKQADDPQLILRKDGDYKVLGYGVGGDPDDPIRWRDDPEVVSAVIRQELAVGVQELYDGVIALYNQDTTEQFNIRATNVTETQNVYLPRTLPDFDKSFLQVSSLLGADIGTDWIYLTADLTEPDDPIQTAGANFVAWDTISFMDDLFVIRDGTTKPIIDLAAGSSGTFLYTHTGGGRPSWNALTAGANITITPNDGAKTVTIASSGVWVGIATTDLEMRGYDIYMNDGGGDGGGDIYMEDGNIIFQSALSALVDGGGFDAVIPYSRNLIGPDGSAISLTWTNDGVEMGSKNIYMNAGGGTGGGDIFMDGGDIRCPSATYLKDGAATPKNAIEPHARTLIGADGTSISLTWTNNGAEMGSKNIYMNAGGGGGGGNIYMDAGDIYCPSTTYLKDGAATPKNAIEPHARTLIGPDGSAISLTWTNNGVELGSKNIYMNAAAGGGAGGGDIYMDGGIIRFATGNILDQAAASADVAGGATLADLITAHNDLLGKLRTAGLLHT